MRRTFFFDQHPPLGKQLVAGIAYMAGYSGNYTFSRIGSSYEAVSVLHNNDRAIVELALTFKVSWTHCCLTVTTKSHLSS